MDETRHGLEDGDYVTFTEVKGMDGLNSAEPRKITTKGELTSILCRFQADSDRAIYLLDRKHYWFGVLQVRWNLCTS